MTLRPLQKGDRLEPGGDVHDTHMDMATLPPGSRPVFFRPGGPVTFWSPVWPLVPHRSVLMDLLHIVDAGVCQYVAGAIFGTLLAHDAYATRHRRKECHAVPSFGAVLILLIWWGRLGA